ncbi:hypothetical protein V8F20_002993 [Naviculisporaceae sp. PSN 640]
MSRLFQGVRRLSFLAPRIAKRVANGQEVTFQRTKVVKKKYGRFITRLAVGCTTTFLMIETYEYLVVNPLAKALEDLPEVEAELEDEDDDGTLVIPLPLTTQAVYPPPYSSKDPEWAEFVRISKDEKLRRELKSSLCRWVLDVASYHPALVHHFGKASRVAGGMLDIDYPLHPPPFYRQLGIYIDDETVGLAFRVRTPSLALMEERVLYPKPLAMAMWGLLSTALLQGKDRLQEALFGPYAYGPGGQDTLRADVPPAIASATAKPSDVQKAMRVIREQATRKPEEFPTSDTTNMTSSSDKPAQKATSPGVSNGPSPPTNSSTNANTKDAKEAPKQLSAMTAAFWDKYFRGYPRKTPYPPRGSVAVTGTVVLDTPKAWLHIDVIAFWDPKTKEYDQPSAIMGLRNYRSKVVRPLR